SRSLSLESFAGSARKAYCLLWKQKGGAGGGGAPAAGAGHGAAASILLPASIADQSVLQGMRLGSLLINRTLSARRCASISLFGSLMGKDARRPTSLNG